MPRQRPTSRHVLCSLLLACFLLLAGTDKAEAATGVSDQTDEVLLTFNYRGVGHVYVTGLYDYDIDRMFLPVTELFSLLQIYYEPSPGDFSLSGNFLTPDQPFRFFFDRYQVVLDGQVFEFTADNFHIGEMDFFVSPGVFEEVFDLFFTVNMGSLMLSLQTNLTMPVEEAAERQRSRRLIEAREVTREFFPLEYDRNRRVMGLGLVDYNVTGNFTQDHPSMNYNLTGGVELMGGDLQGSLTGSWSDNDHRIRGSNLRWRYVVRDNPWFSSFQAGQLTTLGLQPRSIRGFAVSNDPIEPRRIFETHVVDGYTEADSEVELYLNNRLIDYQRANAAGYYRFEFPLTYGTTQLSVNIYTPTGEVRIIDRRLQVPFTYLPRGQVAYNIQGGRTESFLGGGDQERMLVHGDVAIGVSDRLTARVGSEYLEDANDDRPFTYGGLSARLFNQYLINVNIAPDAYYRGVVSVMYPSSRSISLQYTWYEDNPLFQAGGADQNIQASFYTPFTLFGHPMGFRMAGDHRIIGENSITRYRTDLNMRLGRMNLRLNYRDVLFFSDNTYSLGQGQVTANLTYTFMRSPGLPVFVRGMFLRGNATYNTATGGLDEMNVQLSRSIRQWGRINFQGGYDLRSKQHQLRLGFVMDLQSVRSTTNVDFRGERSTVRQNFRGSLAFDRRPDRVLTSNRNQVGRAGASVILFVDNNNSGTFDPGDEIIPARAIRLDRSAQMQVGSDGIIRITQLQSYFRYNLEVARGALPNPLLSPGKDHFSFVADPNQLKRIEIPFYRTGVIDGRVVIFRDGEQLPQPGVRLIIRGVDTDYEETVRNFSDGSYYAMDIPPGSYTIEVDPAQQSFLQAEMRDGPLAFEVLALAEGDFVEDLNLVLSPVIIEEKPEPEPEPTLPPDMPEGGFIVQIGVYSDKEQAKDAMQRLSSIAAIFIVHHEAHESYILHSEPYDDRRKADTTKDTAIEKGYRNAFVKPYSYYEALSEEDLPDHRFVKEAPVGEKYHVVINNFLSIYRAENVRILASERLDQPFLIHYQEEENLYNVYTPSMKDPEAALLLLNQANDSGFPEAYLVHTSAPGPAPMQFQVQLGAYSMEYRTEMAIKMASQNLEVTLRHEYDELTMRYVVRTEPFATIPEAREVLRLIKTHSEYEEAFIVSKPRILNTPVIHDQ